MNDSGKAVFLSYASQDAEAAKRICDALRQAGVEVWFDTDGGLEHGDEWDAKIRRQIKECVLFMPLISANTQAREEGYFRIEWELAAERAMGIAAGTAFILPIVIDDTKEPAALVPDRFRKVQWTKLPGGVLTPEVQARFLKLWSHRAGVVKHRAEAREQKSEDRSQSIPAGSLSAPGWKIYAGLAGAVIALMAGVGWWLLRPVGPVRPESVSQGLQQADAPAKAAVTLDWPKDPELRRVVALLDGLQVIPEDFRLAEDIATRALEKNPTDPEIVTVMARVHSMWLLRGWDRSTARYQKAKSAAERALQLAPDEPEAHVALAIFLYARGAEPARALELAQRAVDLRPDESRFHRMRDNCLFILNVPEVNVFLDLIPEDETPGLREALASAHRTIERFPRDPLARYELSRHYRDIGRWADFERVNEETLALAPVANALVWKARARFGLHGDLAGMKAVLDQVPARVRGIERTVFGYFLYAAFTGHVDAGLEALNGFTDSWMIDFDFRGPKDLLVASLLELKGKKELARARYGLALAELTQARARNPEDFQTYINEAWILYGLGRTEEARVLLRTFGEAMGRPHSISPLATWWFQAIPAHLLMGERATALTLIREAIASRKNGRDTIRRRFALDPRLGAFRDDPEITALLAEPAGLKTKDRSQKTEVSAPIDQKSVAVLAFANLSDDKGNEYFSDGISEELLNVLAKVPGLKVSARTSAFHFKGMNTAIPEIASQLGVAYVVEGSVRKQGDKVRITAQLIKAADGFHVWSDTFTRDLKDIFAVQDEIAGLISQQLQLKLASTDRTARVVNPEAYRLLLEGRQFWNLRNEEGFTKAEAAFTKALAIDPQFAEAHVGLGGVCVIRAIYRELDDVPLEANDLARAVSEGRRALEIDPSSADALAVLAYAQMMGNQLAESDRNFQRALALNPNSALVHCWYALLMSVQGRLDASLGHYQKAAEVDPLWFINLQMLGQSLAFAQRYDQALGIQERANALRTEVFLPNLAEQARTLQALARNEEAFALARQILHNQDQRPRWACDARAIEVLLAGGRRQEAEAEAARLFTRYPEESYLRGFVLAALGRFDEALPFLQRTPGTILRQIYWDTLWDPWRDDPRLLQLMAKVGRAEEYKFARATLARMRQEAGAAK